MSKAKFFKWTVEFQVAECWVADGFDMTDERAHQMLASDLGWAHGSELRARVIKSAPAAEVAKTQGYGEDGAAKIENERSAASLPNGHP